MPMMKNYLLYNLFLPSMERGQVYGCTESGTVIEVLHGGKQSNVCEGQDMRPLVERTEDVGQEKHLPVVEKTPTAIIVKVGSVEHPMDADHWIQFIELVGEKTLYRKYLNPGDKPEAIFPLVDGDFIVREHCNKHGLWKV
jgi:superoxide reductase